MSIAFNYHSGLFSEPTRGRRGLVIPYLSKVVSTRRNHYVTLYVVNLLATKGVGVFFPFFVLESSECFWVKTGAMVHFLGPLGGLV